MPLPVGALGDGGRSVALLFSARMTYEGRTEELVLAWCPIHLMGERGEVGATPFAV